MKFKGTNSKDAPCQTCGKGIHECVGHYGYIDLELPVFHIGYFKCIINILQTICKKCANVLLQNEDKLTYTSKLANRNLSYMVKKKIREKIVTKCKKTTKCPHCKEVNGFVKKMTAGKGSTGNSVLKIVHEKNKGKDKTLLLQEQLREFHTVIQSNPDIKNALIGSVIPEVLTPIDVLKLFQRIPEKDIILLAMDPKK